MAHSELVLDCSRIASVHSGLGRFAVAISRALRAIGINHDLVAGCDDFPSTTSLVPRILRKNSNVRILNPIAWMVYARFGFPCRSNTPMFSVMQNLVPKSRNQIVTIHDLRPYFYPDNLLQHFYWKYVLPRSLRNAKAIVTVSETSREKIRVAYGISSDRIHVVSNCFTPTETSSDAHEPRVNRLLCVGCNWKHKNIHELLEMHEVWRGKYNIDIVMARTHYLTVLKDIVARRNLEDAVTFHHGVSDETLRFMYRRSRALVYPSLDEGFGIPPLEAMSYGLPVIASDIPVFRELFLDAPLYVHLGRRESWEAVLRNLDSEGTISRRVEIGHGVARNYTPEMMMRQLVSMLGVVWPELVKNQQYESCARNSP